MRKAMLLAVSMLLFAACSKEEPTAPEPTWLTETKALLVGSWHGELYSESLNTTESEDIVFSPFSTPYEEVSLFGTFEAYGVAEVEQYQNDHLLQVSKRCLFTIVGKEEGKGVTVSFYPCDEDNEVVGKEDKRTLVRVSSTEFKMRPYGTTERNNKTYTKL